MIRFKSIAITIAIMCSLFTMVNSAQAQIEIIDMYTPSKTDGWFYHYAYIETDKPFDGVDWFIGDPDDDLSWVSTTPGDGVKTRAWLYPSWVDFPGHIEGAKYRVAARPWYYDDDTNCWWDRASRDFTVFQAKTDWKQEPRSSVWCYSEISRHYYRPQRQDVRADYYAYAWNPLDKDEVRALFADRIYMLEYYLDVFGLGVSDFARKTYPAEQLPPQDYAGFKSHTLTVSVQFGTAGNKYVSNASVAHGLNGHAPGDPNFSARIGIENEIEFEREE